MVLLLLVTPAFASHAETHETGWFEYVYSEDDTEVLYCNGLSGIEVGAGIWIHDRPGPGSGKSIVPGWEYGDGGTWIYMETNGIDRLQIGGTSPVPSIEGVTQMDDPFHDECPNSDTLLL